jgi:hypothetical protein
MIESFKGTTAPTQSPPAFNRIDGPTMLYVIKVESEFYVRARSSLADRQTRALMHAELFAVFEKRGDPFQ